MSPKAFVSIRFRQLFKRSLNWENPCDINEKINWLKFYGDTTEWPRLADKYRVREFVAERGLSSLLVPLYGCWQEAEDIEWERLPNAFIMKVNNGSGDVLVCKDKSLLDTKQQTAHFHRLLRMKFGYQMAEPHYNHIPPVIIAEELLDYRLQSSPSTSMIDYKVFAFNGNPTYILTCSDRTSKSVQLGVYDQAWTFHPEFSISTSHCPLSTTVLAKPSTLDQMLHAASVLSSGFPFMRVDFYEVNQHLYFGEITLTPAAGLMDYFTPEFLLKLGQQCHLNL